MAAGALVGSVAILVAANLQALQAIAASTEEISVHLTSHDLRTTLARQPDLRFAGGSATVGERIDIETGAKGQALTAGFGVAMTATSAYLLRNELPTGLRDEADRLHHTEHLHHYTGLRLPLRPRGRRIRKPGRQSCTRRTANDGADHTFTITEAGRSVWPIRPIGVRNRLLP
ncbi:hypothetical protein [Nocardia sp. NBC_01009]|uniref:hypothetical protein n=1 Tax=Nocardia sp. NBC_01009 TaxID=2975996 RepID=UPI003867822A|nr:hypothetical protein OHA42_19005 [Nocardia sp. NBC_01009]